MKEVLYMMRLICSSEGCSGFILNLTLICNLLRHHKTSNQIFLVPIYVSSLLGLYLCSAIAVMNFTHIFYDGTLAVPLIGPLVEYIPNFWRDILYEAAFVIMTYTWILTPATTILQYTSFIKFSNNENVLMPNSHIDRDELSQGKRLLIAFTPTAFCLILIAYTIPMTMPSPALAEIMQASLKEFYELEPNEFLFCYGVSFKHARINNGKSVVLFVFMFAALPYSISYVIIVTLMIMIRKLLASQAFALSTRTLHLQRQFFVMQLLQSFLPLVILSVPLIVIMCGALTGAQLGYWSLPLTIFVWLCPVVQASVQLRYVMQSHSSSSKTVRVHFSLSTASRRVSNVV